MPFTPMRPLIAGERLFVRRMTKAGAELACLDINSGEIIWHQRPGHSVLTDPVIWNGRLFVLLLNKIDDEVLQVEAAWFDSVTGSVVSSRPLIRLREPPERWYSGQLSTSNRTSVCTVAGMTIGFDWKGDLRWVRRHLLMRKPVDELAEDFRVAPPKIIGERVIVSSPGVREICCLDEQTGRNIWKCACLTSADCLTSLNRVSWSTHCLGWLHSIKKRAESFGVLQ